MYIQIVFAKLGACVKIGQGPGLVANARKWNVMTLPVLAILYLSAIKYKNDPRSLAIKAFKIAIKGL